MPWRVSVHQVRDTFNLSFPHMTETRFLRIFGDADHMHIFGNFVWDESVPGMSIRDDLNGGVQGLETSGVTLPLEFELRSEPPDSGSARARFLDCHAVNSSADPNCTIRSFEIVVSERARTALSDAADEIDFVPVRIVGAPIQYYALWVRRTADVVWREESVLDEYPPGSGRFQIKRARIRDASGTVRFAVRQERRNYAWVYDYVTRDFLALVKKARLTGFEFADPYTRKTVRL